MAAKKHKTKKPPITKAAAATAAAISSRLQEWPWSELPPTILNLRAHNHRLLNHLDLSSCPAVTKSMPPPPSRCDSRQRPRPHPRLRLVASIESPYSSPHHSHGRSHFLADGASIADAEHWWCYLRSGPKPEPSPPPLGPNIWLRGVTSLGPALTVTYIIDRPRFYREASVRHVCATRDPFDDDGEKKFLEFTNLVCFRGVYYAISLQGAVAAMEVVDTRLRITGVGPTRAVPVSESRFFKEFFVEMKGEILLIFLVHRKSLAVVDHVEVFGLDLDRLCWIRVERLGGKVIFLNDWCFGGESERIGCRDDRVYFTQGILEKSWRVYDMKSCCISPVFENEWGQAKQS